MSNGFCYRGIKRVLRYLKGSANYGLLNRSGKIDFSVHVGSDSTSDATDRKSMSGFVVSLGNTTINWGAKKQDSVALSACDARYIATSFETQEAVRMRKVISTIRIPPHGPTKVFPANQEGATWTMEQKNISKREKHVGIRLHFIQDLVSNGEILKKHIATRFSDADVLTTTWKIKTC